VSTRQGSAAGPARNGTVRRAAPALVGVAALVAVGLIALRVGSAGLRTAENDRLAAVEHVVLDLGPKLRATQASEELDPVVELAGFAPDDPVANQLALGRFRSGATGPDLGLAALVDLDGHTLASSVPDQTVDVAALGSTWPDAVRGIRGTTPAFRQRDSLSTAALIPVGAGRPWAVLVVVKDVRTATEQEFFVRYGTLDGSPGGFSMVDRNGVAVSSWRPPAVGQTVMTPARAAELPVGETATWTEARPQGELLMVGSAQSNGYALLFEQATDHLYADLRAAQHQRDVTLLAVLAVALGALVLFQLARERAARRAEGRRRALLANSQDLVVVTDRQGLLTFVSPAIGSLLGHAPEAWRHRPLLDLCHPDDAGRLRRLLHDGGEGTLLNVRLRDVRGDWEWFDVEASDHSGHGDVGGILLTCHEVGQRKALQEELSRQATHDDLTGLPNRAALTTRLEALVDDGRPRRPFAVLYIDLDLFKPVNDTYGHEAGDRVLGVIAERFRGAAGPSGFVSRLGGDEFVVLLDGADDAQARAGARQLREAARAPIPVAATIVHVDASIGIALAEPAAEVEHPDLLVRRADQAMYRAKEGGRGRWEVVGPEATTSATPGRSVPWPDAARPTAATAGSPRRGPSTPVARRSWPDAPAGSAPTRRTRRAAVGPVLVAAAVVAAIAAFGQTQTAAAQRAAEQQRVALRLDMTVVGADYYSKKFDPDLIVTIMSSLPWALDGAATDTFIIDQIARTFAVGKDSDVTVVLAALDGRVLTSIPAGRGLPVSTAGAPWRDAAGGVPSMEPLVETAGGPHIHLVEPVLRDGKPAAVLVIDVASRDDIIQHLLEQLGSLGLPNGGWSLVDARGVAFASWKPELIGRQLTDPEVLAAVRIGDGSATTHGGDVVLATPMASMWRSSPTSHAWLVYVEPTDEFFHDLRVGQTERDLSLLGVLLAAVAGLGYVNHRRERAIRRSEHRLHTLLQHAHDIVVVLGPDRSARFVSSAITGLLGHAPEGAIGHNVLDLVHPADVARLDEAIDSALPHTASSVNDVRLAERDGSYRWFDIDAIDLRDHPEVGGILLTCHESSERKAFQDQLSFRAAHDALTGLPNRAAFAAHLERLAVGVTEEHFAVLFIDLDHFKPVNDTFGHDAGDAVLRTVADRLEAEIRGDDGDRPADMVCRLGGDEFAVLLVDVTEHLARATAERILASVREPIVVDGTAIGLSATVGVAVSHPGRDHPDAVLRSADAAMYQAKLSGRDSYEFCVS
jgi:diguanylate cyclase (GGDEF)-like protein/PAS domain S-box-containing protein